MFGNRISGSGQTRPPDSGGSPTSAPPGLEQRPLLLKASPVKNSGKEDCLHMHSQASQARQARPQPGTALNTDDHLLPQPLGPFRSPTASRRGLLGPGPAHQQVQPDSGSAANIQAGCLNSKQSCEENTEICLTSPQRGLYPRGALEEIFTTRIMTTTGNYRMQILMPLDLVWIKEALYRRAERGSVKRSCLPKRSRDSKARQPDPSG